MPALNDKGRARHKRYRDSGDVLHVVLRDPQARQALAVIRQAAEREGVTLAIAVGVALAVAVRAAGGPEGAGP